MVSDHSNQGDSFGPDLSSTIDDDLPAARDPIDLHDVLGELLVAMCVVEMVYRTLWWRMDSFSDEIGSCAMALGHGFEMLDTVYNRFDQALLDYSGPDDDPHDSLDADDRDDERPDQGDVQQADHLNDRHLVQRAGRAGREAAAGGRRLVLIS